MTINPKLLEPTLLWSNPNPNASFSAQTLTNVDPRGYKYVFFAFKGEQATYRGLMYSNKCEVDFSNSKRVSGALNCGVRVRPFEWNVYNSLNFGAGYNIAQAQNDDSVCVPIYLYGTNIL